MTKELLFLVRLDDGRQVHVYGKDKEIAVDILVRQSLVCFNHRYMRNNVQTIQCIQKEEERIG